eukprot:TRINITY_DN40202_c0_g1_i1.p1 TRINITY_DN40202_c0_g1~~TRINITY_DN40202_c0_g1_i1.p1  ORF type:complete len:625 (+),score=155.49 TRINITY_DN40202_c0_g1_i1:70-1944(+)
MVSVPQPPFGGQRHLSSRSFSRDDAAEKGAAGPSAWGFSANRLARALAEVQAANPFTGRDVPRVDVPQRPRLSIRASVDAQLSSLQRYIQQLQYNFLPRTFFNCNKYRPLCRILDTAREVIREALPIRCLEATFVGLCLTQGMREVDRVPISFKTSFAGKTHRHIVLSVRHGKAWGALGLSRKTDLMYKRLGQADGLSGLVHGYLAAYKRHGHEVVTVKVGLPVTHDPTSGMVPCWKFIVLNLRTMAWANAAAVLEKFSAMATRLAQEWERDSATSNRKSRHGSAGRRKHASLQMLGAAVVREAAVRRSTSSSTNADRRAVASIDDTSASEPPDSCTSRVADRPSPIFVLADSGYAGFCDSDDDGVSDYDTNPAANAASSWSAADCCSDDDAGSENAERVSCILADRSPFRRNQFTSPSTAAVVRRGLRRHPPPVASSTDTDRSSDQRGAAGATRLRRRKGLPERREPPPKPSTSVAQPSTPLPPAASVSPAVAAQPRRAEEASCGGTAPSPSPALQDAGLVSDSSSDDGLYSITPSGRRRRLSPLRLRSGPPRSPRSPQCGPSPELTLNGNSTPASHTGQSGARGRRTAAEASPTVAEAHTVSDASISLSVSASSGPDRVVRA